MLHYIFQTIIFQLLFLLAYDIVLKKETFFNHNRAYLLITSLVSLILPFVKLDILNSVLANQYIVSLPEVIIGNISSISNEVNGGDSLANQDFLSFFSALNVYVLITVIVFTVFMIRLFKIIKLIYKNEKSKVSNLTIVYLKTTNTAFSFFNYVFLGNSLSDKETQYIIEHERIHVQQKHTLDLLWFELLKIIFWFNPLVYLYQNRASNLHEFIADQNAIKDNKSNYYQQLLQQVFSVKNCSFINPFFKKSLIKKRITMLQKSKSKQIKMTKFLVVIPLTLAMLMYTSCFNSSQNNEVGKEISFYTSAIKNQLAKQGNISDEEDNALNLLYKVMKGTEFDPKLVEEVHQLIAKENKSDIEQKLSDLLDTIQIKGDISDNDEAAIKDLLILTLKDSFNDPYLNEAIERVEIPFGVVDTPPLFEDCKSVTGKAEQKKCFSDIINKHVRENFNAKIADDLGIDKGKKRIMVHFKINNKGEIVDLKSDAEHPDLEAEGKRLIKLLPKITPGMQEGKPVSVGYTLPISFQVN